MAVRADLGSPHQHQRPVSLGSLASDHAPYPEDAIPNLPYARESAVAAARQFIERFKPDMIITGHPDERHVDHRTGNWIVVKAMQQLLREGAISRDTKLIVDQVTDPPPPSPRPIITKSKRSTSQAKRRASGRKRPGITSRRMAITSRPTSPISTSCPATKPTRISNPRLARARRLERTALAAPHYIAAVK